MAELVSDELTGRIPKVAGIQQLVELPFIQLATYRVPKRPRAQLHQVERVA